MEERYTITFEADERFFMLYEFRLLEKNNESITGERRSPSIDESLETIRGILAKLTDATPNVTSAAAILGAAGRKKNTEAQAKASRQNARKGAGRPRLYARIRMEITRSALEDTPTEIYQQRTKWLADYEFKPRQEYKSLEELLTANGLKEEDLLLE